MTERAPHRTLLVPIDIHGIEPRSLEILVRIARQLDRKLLALFLEDVRLQQVADLPFTTEIVLSSGRERCMGRQELSRRHSAVARDTRRRLVELARREHLELQFESATGSRWHSALQRAEQQDVIFSPRPRWQDHRAANSHQRPIQRLGLVVGDAHRDAQVMAAAGALIEAELVNDIYVLCRAPPDESQLKALQHTGARVRLQSHPGDGESLSTLIRQSTFQLLLLPAAVIETIAHDSLEQALERTGGQVLVVH